MIDQIDAQFTSDVGRQEDGCLSNPASKNPLLEAIPRILECDIGVSPEGGFIELVPVPNESFSSGRGIAQLVDTTAK